MANNVKNDHSELVGLMDGCWDADPDHWIDEPGKYVGMVSDYQYRDVVTDEEKALNIPGRKVVDVTFSSKNGKARATYWLTEKAALFVKDLFKQAGLTLDEIKKADSPWPLLAGKLFSFRVVQQESNDRFCEVDVTTVRAYKSAEKQG